MARSSMLVLSDVWRHLTCFSLNGSGSRSEPIFSAQLRDKGVGHENWPQSLHWNWQRKAPELKLLAACGVGIVFDERWQGVMMTKSIPMWQGLTQTAANR